MFCIGMALQYIFLIQHNSSTLSRFYPAPALDLFLFLISIVLTSSSQSVRGSCHFQFFTSALPGDKTSCFKKHFQVHPFYFPSSFSCVCSFSSKRNNENNLLHKHRFYSLQHQAFTNSADRSLTHACFFSQIDNSYLFFLLF